MRRSKIGARPVVSLLLGVLIATGCCIGEADMAAAFGVFGFGRAGGYGRPMPGGPQWRRMPPRPVTGGGRTIGRYPGRGGGGTRVGRGGGWPSRYHPIARAGIVGGGAVGGGNVRGGGGTNGNIAAPPRGETRFVADEIITAFAPGATPQAINRIARRYNLTRIESQSFPLIGASLYRWRIGGRGSAVNVLRALGDERIVASAQPNYVFTLQEDAAKAAADTPGTPSSPGTPDTRAPTAPGTSGTQGDAAQYVLQKLQIEQAQKIATGKNVLVAVIDSEIDSKHINLNGTIVKSFDALGHDEAPHPHGTSIAGAIVSHGKLLGIAPGAQLLAVHAFDDTPGAAKGTSYAIYKGLQWAADNGARVVNMSFAGPADPMMERMLTAAYDKGMVLIAAAGNAGPQSAPLYPAADPDVIAVTATDDNDQLFKMDNRGPYITVSAPGVDILALAPDDAYQVTTGTSIAAAHVSGLAALLLERKPAANPQEIRKIITSTAKPLQLSGEDANPAVGLANAYRAVTSLDGQIGAAK